MNNQKSKAKWKLYGDRNSKTFHDSLKIKLASENVISIIDKDGLSYTTPEPIQLANLEYFQNLLAN